MTIRATIEMVMANPPSRATSALVPHNRWDLLDVPTLGEWEPSLRITVVLPYFEAFAALERTLVGLARQTYPEHLTEIVVVDDGSSPPLAFPQAWRDSVLSGLHVRLVHQQDRGFGLARARNTGANRATGQILVFLDCDMIPERQHLEAHARWHHVCDHAVSLGSRRHVDIDGITRAQVESAAINGTFEELFSQRDWTEPEWLARHMVRMRDLTAPHDDLFRAVTGGNLGVRADLFHRVGGFDESFDQWGSEDTDIGHRLFLAGAVLVPERAAACWHQGVHHGLEPEERRSLNEQRARLSQTIAHPGFRRTVPGRSYEVPRILIELTVTDEPHFAVTATIESILANDIHDLKVLLRIPPGHPDRRLIERPWAGDPRVIDAEPPSHFRVPYRMSAPVGVSMDRDAVRSILAIMTDPEAPVGVLEIQLQDPDAGAVRVTSTRALGRAELAGAEAPLTLAGELFGSRTVAGHDVGVHWAKVTDPRRLASPAQVAARSASTRVRSRLAPLLMVDSPLGWLTRGAAGRLLAAADQQIAEALDDAATARFQASRSRYELDRLAGRRPVRLALAFAGLRSLRGIAALPARLKDAMARLDPPPEPVLPTAKPPKKFSTQGAEQEAAGLPRPAHRDPRFANIRVLHLGGVGRFFGLVQHTIVDPTNWRRQLEDRPDLVLIEPPAGNPDWDPLDGDLPQLLETAEQHGIATVRIGIATRGGPGSPTLELIESAPESGAPNIDEALAGGRLSPSIDPSIMNPVGWSRQPEHPAVAVLQRVPDDSGIRFLDSFDPPILAIRPADLTSRSADPATQPADPATQPAEPEPGAAGVHREEEVSSPDELQQALKRAGVLVDHPAWRTDASAAYRTWLAALACGLPVVVANDGTNDPDMLTLPDGTRLHLPPGAIAVESSQAADAVRELLADDDLRERRGIVGRRWVLREASPTASLAGILGHLGIQIGEPLRTTVLLATNRPEFLSRALDNVARQTQPNVDVSLVLHGQGFDDIDLDEDEQALPMVSSIVRAPESWTLGDCLNAALDRARGDLVAKMDDDDHYGASHLEDLVAAWCYSGADIVGKRVEFVHLANRDVTVRRPATAPERDRRHVGGPTLLASRELLRAFRFLRLPNRVDSTLYERVLAAGGRIYGIHSRDFVLGRHGEGHVWDVSDEEFLDAAVAVRPGLDVKFAASDPSADD